MKCSSESFHNLPYFWNKKSCFHLMLLYFFPNECPGLCHYRPGQAFIREKIKKHEIKNEKTYLGFLTPKLLQILKRLAGTFHQAI